MVSSARATRRHRAHTLTHGHTPEHGAGHSHLLATQFCYRARVYCRPRAPALGLLSFRGSAKCLPTHRSCLPPRQAGR